jgi:sugar phosphate isomerase/epimerase
VRQIPVALQLYSVRDHAAADYLGTLRKVAQIGYAGVELAGTPIPISEIKKVCADLGLAIPSAHFGYDALVSETTATIEAAMEMGVSYVTCSGLFNELRETEAGCRKGGGALSKAGEELAKHGIELCYHNHSFEFQKLDGKTVYDILFESSDPRYLKAQLDTYWVLHGGEDPVALIRRLSGRCPLLHIKDMADDAERSFAEIGEGILDFGAIFSAAQDAGVQWYIVEQDTCKRDPFESVKISLDNLNKMGAA